MKTIQKSLLAAAVGSAALSGNVWAQEANSFAEALSAGTVKLHLRPRYESVDQDGAEDATAATLKTRLTYTSGTYNGFGMVLEMDDTSSIGDVDWNDGLNGLDTAVIADPEVTEVNQAYLSYNNWSTTFKYGRQRIILDNQRFIGGVGWRQDEQTYDGFSLDSKPMENLSIFYSYITQVNRILAEAADHNHETHLLNGKFDTSAGKLIGYAYLIDNQTAVATSTDTIGARWEGKFGENLGYNLEYATQSEGGDRDDDFSADYMLAEVTGSIPLGESALGLKAGYEVLGSDDGEAAFITPLATVHAFQGWADKFLSTPPDGVNDLYFGANGKIGSFTLAAIYHTFEANEGDADYGSEIDFVAGTKVGPVGLTFKYADYSADDFATDTQKIWVMAAMTF